MNEKTARLSKVQVVLVILAMALVSCAILTAALPATAATIAWGSTGEDVRKVQQRLKDWGYYKGSVDGVFGQATYNAVISFQKANGLNADGKVGAQTAAAIGITLSGSTATSATSSGSYSSADTYLLARAVYAEARGEPYTGQVAVAAVILNRVKNAQFPNTIAGVIYQPGAFTCVNDGQINLAPDDTAIRAAQDAMNGWDPSGGALYYYNPNKAVVAWIFSRTTITVIGNHRFAL